MRNSVKIRLWARKAWHYAKEKPILPLGTIGVASGLYLPMEGIKAILKGEVLAALISASAILAGFFSTGMTIVLSLEGRPVMEMLDRLGMRKRVNSSLWQATRWLLMLSAVCIIALIVGVQCGWAARTAGGIVLGFTAASGLLSYRAIRIVAALLERHADETDGDNQVE